MRGRDRGLGADRILPGGPGLWGWAGAPDLGRGFRIAAVYAPAAAIVGEWVGGSRGLGAVMIQSSGRMKIDQMFAALAVTILIAVLFKATVSRAIPGDERSARSGLVQTSAGRAPLRKPWLLSVGQSNRRFRAAAGLYKSAGSC